MKLIMLYNAILLALAAHSAHAHGTGLIRHRGPLTKSYSDGPSSYLPTSTFNSTSPSQTPSPEPIAELHYKYLDVVVKLLSESTNECSFDNVVHRPSWAQMSDGARESYLSAVSCLHGRLPNWNKDTVFTTASRFRIDDFVVERTFMGRSHLFTGTFFQLNRWYLNLYEKALRLECGYDGALPYWDFSEHHQNITEDPIFANNATSMGGNGAPYPGGHGWVYLRYYNESFHIPPGSGGGCVYASPFHGEVVRLGVPLRYDEEYAKSSSFVWPTLENFEDLDMVFNDSTSPFQTNDRCITRDLNEYLGRFLGPLRIEDDLACQDLGCLLDRVNGIPVKSSHVLNLVNAARFAVGGLQLDPASAATDPIFWLMHANIDRLFSLWQAQDAAHRFNETAHNQNPFNWMTGCPATDEPVRPDTMIRMAWLDDITPTRRVSDFGPLMEAETCYYYS